MITDEFKERQLKRWTSWRIWINKSANVHAGQCIDVHDAVVVRDGDSVGLESHGLHIPLSLIDGWTAITPVHTQQEVQ